MYCLSIHPCVNNFSQLFYIKFFIFFRMWLGIFNLQKLMQLSFMVKVLFEHKGTIEHRFFPKIQLSRCLVLIVNKISCNLHCKPVLQKNFIFKVWPEMVLTNLIPLFVKSNISVWKPIDSHWLKNVLLKLFSLQLYLFFCS